MKQIILILIVCVLIACKQKIQNIEETQIQNDNTNKQSTKINSNIYGNYVDDNYANRNDGNDWVAVSVKQSDNKSVFVSVRSRADNKKPTCVFDTKAFKIDDNSYQTMYNGVRIIFNFKQDNISIVTENQEDLGILNFFCNGGATIGGTYKKINEHLDSKQVDPTLFSKVLNLQGVGFNISSIKKNGINTLSIFTFGLEKHDYNNSFNIKDEQVIDAEVEDLNSDGYPELFVYTQSDNSKAYGYVYAFSVNNKSSMSEVYFQPTIENPKINQGYMGHDEFSIVENSLVQRFPIYKKDDTITKPTGGTRQVSYNLVEGEALRKLEVEKITSY